MADIPGLIQHLRSQAAPGSADASALAAQFGVEEALVRNAMTALSRAHPRPDPARKVAPINIGAGLWTRIKNAPGLSILVCGVISFASLLLSEFLTKPLSYVGLVMLVAGLAAAFGIALVGRRARYGLLVGPALMGSVLLENLLWERGVIDGKLWLGVGLLAIFLSTIGVVFSIAGGLIWVRKQKSAEKSLTRQQMLDRLLQVRLALEYPRTTYVPNRWQRFVADVRRHFWLYTVGAALLLALAQGFAMRAYMPVLDKVPPSGPAQVPLTQKELMAIAILAVLGFLQFLLMVVIGYFGRSLGRALGGSFLYLAISFVPGLIGVNPDNIARFQKLPIEQIISSYVFFFFCAAIGAGAAGIEHFSLQAKLRQENDPDALLAELLDLEIKLGGGMQESYVLVVDVAGSTAMKKDADPLVAEWTFRSYQELLARVGGLHVGRVESTAGDGAVLGFPSADQALAAARAILAAMPEFNANTNRLGEDFVLRIGLRCGEVRGDLNEVQFTRVIDVAAHVEAASPRNGIGMTSAFLEKLSTPPPVTAMDSSVDGYTVYTTA